MHPDVVVIGSLNMDLVVRAPRLPKGGETLAGHTFTTAPGGKGANQAVASGLAGARTSFGWSIRQLPKRCTKIAQNPCSNSLRSWVRKSSATKAQKPMS